MSKPTDNNNESNSSVVVGAGLAGLSTALHLAEHQHVTILAKQKITESATAWAQGGIAGVIDDNDNIDSHVADTVRVGAGLVDENVARFVARESTRAVDWLVGEGVPFSMETDGSSGLHLAREGGHSIRRIAHAADATGQKILETLLHKAAVHPNITFLENWITLDLITDKHCVEYPGNISNETESLNPRIRKCYGVYALNIANNKIETIVRPTTVLATGGLGKVYKYTTNPDTATGDGIAMCWRAKCRVANMEFIQFHPTCLYHPQDRSFLITEALRGEGAQLQLHDGHRFMLEYDTQAELAPRDTVARAIDMEIKKRGLDFVYLDARHLGKEFLQQRFPKIYGRCHALGIDIATDRIPVVPSAHYSCGGVVTNMQGKTDLEGLYVVGESACTGLHGGNRLASNSLLECVVFGQAAARAIASLQVSTPPAIRPWDESQVEDADELVVIAHNWDELRSLMWNYVGIARTTRRLQRALHRIHFLRNEVHEHYSNFKVNSDLIELRNLLECAELIVRSSLARGESRGLHSNRDFPQAYPISYPTILTPEYD